MQVQSEVNNIATLFESSLSTRIASFLEYLSITGNANYLVSALNTNLVIVTYQNTPDRLLAAHTMSYNRGLRDEQRYDLSVTCGTANPTSPVSFFGDYRSIYKDAHTTWFEFSDDRDFVQGFFGGCTAFSALLQSTLDCLYDSVCLATLPENFPALNSVS